MYYLNHSNRPVRTRMPGGVGGAQLIMAAPYPDVPGPDVQIKNRPSQGPAVCDA